MKSHSYGGMLYPQLYQKFKNAQEIADTINRSRAYVFKALNRGFTERELSLLQRAIERKETQCQL